MMSGSRSRKTVHIRLNEPNSIRVYLSYSKDDFLVEWLQVIIFEMTCDVHEVAYISIGWLVHDVVTEDIRIILHHLGHFEPGIFVVLSQLLRFEEICKASANILGFGIRSAPFSSIVAF